MTGISRLSIENFDGTNPLASGPISGLVRMRLRKKATIMIMTRNFIRFSRTLYRFLAQKIKMIPRGVKINGQTRSFIPVIPCMPIPIPRLLPNWKLDVERKAEIPITKANHLP